MMERHGESLTWDQWPENCRTPEKAAAYLRKLRSGDREAVDYRLGFYAFVQWLCYRQWQALRAHADRRAVSSRSASSGVCAVSTLVALLSTSVPSISKMTALGRGRGISGSTA